MWARLPFTHASDFVRAARRTGDLSQRELAREAGVSKSLVSRIESQETDPRFSVMCRLLAAAGCRLLVLDRHGSALARSDTDHLLDGGLRRYPAHLDIRAVDSPRDWWFGTFPTDGSPLPRHTYDLSRWERDVRRRRLSGDEADA